MSRAQAPIDWRFARLGDERRAFNQFPLAFLSALTLSAVFRLEKILWRMLA
jgi:hypothetical protein